MLRVNTDHLRRQVVDLCPGGVWNQNGDVTVACSSCQSGSPYLEGCQASTRSPMHFYSRWREWRCVESERQGDHHPVARSYRYTPHLLSELSHVGELRPDGLVLHPYMSGISEKTGTWYQNGDIEITGFGMSVVGTWRASSGVRVGSAEHPASAFRNLCCQGVLLGARRQCLLDPQRNGRLRCVPGMLFFLDPTRSSSEKMEMTTQYTRYLNDSTPWKQLGNQPIFNVTGTSSQGR